MCILGRKREGETCTAVCDRAKLKVTLMSYKRLPMEVGSAGMAYFSTGIDELSVVFLG